MKRLPLLFGMVMVLVQLTGCGGGGSSPPVPRSEDPNLPAEVREYEAKQEKRWAERAANSPLAKAKNRSTKKP